jgi:hypothetical protein
MKLGIGCEMQVYQLIELLMQCDPYKRVVMMDQNGFLITVLDHVEDQTDERDSVELHPYRVEWVYES